VTRSFPRVQAFAGGSEQRPQRLPAALLPAAAGGLQRVADVPIYFADPLARRAPALQKTRDAAAPTARMRAQTLQTLGVTDGAAVRVRQENGEVVLTARADETVPAACVRVAAGHASTAALGDMFGVINVERA
jgi:NADH-quinone oxidoreductase subunit G